MFPTLLETKKWKDTDIKIVCGSKMEFEEKSMRDTLENGEKPQDRKFAFGNNYKNAGAILN